MPAMDGPSALRNGADVSKLSVQELHLLVQQWEKADFPDAFSNSDKEGHFRLPPDSTFSAGGHLWAAFDPSCYFRGRQPIFTPQIVGELQRGASLLSVGAGPAYTERLLVSRLHVPIQNIFLNDLNPEVLPAGFSQFGFDMHDPWPPLGRKFNYIVFLESAPFGRYSTRWAETAEENIELKTKAFCNVIRNAAGFLAPEGQIRISIGVMQRPLDQSVTSELMADFPNAKLAEEMGRTLVFSI